MTNKQPKNTTFDVSVRYMIFKRSQKGRLQIPKEQEMYTSFESAVFDENGYETQVEANEAIIAHMEAEYRRRDSWGYSTKYQKTDEYYILPVTSFTLTACP